MALPQVRVMEETNLPVGYCGARANTQFLKGGGEG